MKLADFIIFFLIDSFDDIFLKFIQARSQKIKVFTEQATHVCKHIAYFLRHCLTEVGGDLRYDRLDDSTDFLLVSRILREKRVLELHDGAYHDLHLSSLLLSFVNDVVILKNLMDEFVHLKHRSCTFCLYEWKFKHPFIFQGYDSANSGLVALHSGDVLLDRVPRHRLALQLIGHIKFILIN